MKRSAVALLVLGLLQMTGDVLERAGLERVGRSVKGIGAATTASPVPGAVSAVRGLETCSTRFHLEWTDRSGIDRTLPLTPEVYARVRGPYDRRNVYGAALACWPMTESDDRTKPLYRSVINHALTGEAPLLRELGIDPADVAGPVRVRYEPLPGTGSGGMPRVLQAPFP